MKGRLQEDRLENLTFPRSAKTIQSNLSTNHYFTYKVKTYHEKNQLPLHARDDDVHERVHRTGR